MELFWNVLSWLRRNIWIITATLSFLTTIVVISVDELRNKLMAPSETITDSYQPLRDELNSMCQECYNCSTPVLFWAITTPEAHKNDHALAEIFSSISSGINDTCTACRAIKKAHDDGDKCWEDHNNLLEGAVNY